MTRLTRFERGGAFVPFLMLGDPDPSSCRALLDEVVASGADALELGIPFSDPVADGPTIQAAARRALRHGVTPGLCFDLIEDLRTRHPEIPVGLLVYANLVLARGMDDFYARAGRAGVDGVLVADVPAREGEPFARAARSSGVDPVFIAAPNTPAPVLRRIAELGGGFTYVVARRGVTGVRNEAVMPPAELFRALTEVHAPPAVVGFGISEPEHVRSALALGAAGAISGSAVIQRIERLRRDPAMCRDEVGGFVRRMKDATLAE